MLRRGVSVVVPVYNSEASLEALVTRLESSLRAVGSDFEVILVSDGSQDRSWEVIRRLVSTHNGVVGVNLMRNFGQHNALLAGIRLARYSVTVTMDDDLQHPPEEIPLLLRRLDEGFDVVYGTPTSFHHGVFRNFFSRFAKIAMSRAMRMDTLVDLSAFRAFRTELRQAFDTYSSPQVLLDVLLSWGTTAFSSVAVSHEARRFGRSNYTPRKLFNHAMLILTGFSTAPLRFASSLGFVFTLFGIGVLVYVVGRYLITGGSVPGFPFLASVIAIFSGAQLFALGILGEYLARVFSRTIEQPVYVVKEVAAHEADC